MAPGMRRVFSAFAALFFQAGSGPVFCLPKTL
jgi:hypothetical protein